MHVPPLTACNSCSSNHPQPTTHPRYSVSCASRSLDTGRLNPETYQLFDAVEKHYGIRIEYTFPDAQETMELVRTKGMFSFYEDGHQECCRVRKVCSKGGGRVEGDEGGGLVATERRCKPHALIAWSLMQG